MAMRKGFPLVVRCSSVIVSTPPMNRLFSLLLPPFPECSSVDCAAGPGNEEHRVPLLSQKKMFHLHTPSLISPVQGDALSLYTIALATVVVRTVGHGEQKILQARPGFLDYLKGSLGIFGGSTQRQSVGSRFQHRGEWVCVLR